jgi:serine/threonine-protein kinase
LYLWVVPASLRPQERCGEVIAERYELLELIASGGQGHVYRAKDRVDGDIVALKLLRNRFAQDSNWRERMFREARALSLLTPTAAVQVLDQKWTDDGSLCLVMEWLDGMPLDDKLAAIERSGTRIDPVDLLPIIGPIVATLEVAHANGILHRDIKPSNLFVLDDGSVRLIDFGFAKFERMRGMTALGQVAGSPTYLAPECWDPRRRNLSRKVDVYSLGAVIFRALAGRPPFEGTVVELMRTVPTAERPSLFALRPDLPRDVDLWVQSALAAKPQERFDTAAALWTAFRLATGTAHSEARDTRRRLFAATT